MQVFYSLEAVVNPSVGVRGGGTAQVPSAYVAAANGAIEEHPETVGAINLAPGQRIGSRSAGGGGYGNPLLREPERVLADVQEGYVTIERAYDVYGVVMTGDPARFETLAVDEAATSARRLSLQT